MWIHKKAKEKQRRNTGLRTRKWTYSFIKRGTVAKIIVSLGNESLVKPVRTETTTFAMPGPRCVQCTIELQNSATQLFYLTPHHHPYCWYVHLPLLCSFYLQIFSVFLVCVCVCTRVCPNNDTLSGLDLTRALGSTIYKLIIINFVSLYIFVNYYSANIKC